MAEEILYTGVCKKKGCGVALDEHTWFKDGKVIGGRMGPPVCPTRKEAKVT